MKFTPQRFISSRQFYSSKASSAGFCAGKVKLSTSSSEGKTLITKISDAGDVLGLNATISNHPYEVTARNIDALVGTNSEPHLRSCLQSTHSRLCRSS